MSDILDALDKLSDARHALNLIEMATRYPSPGIIDPDESAINAGCFTVRGHLEAAQAILEKLKGGEA